MKNIKIIFQIIIILNIIFYANASANAISIDDSYSPKHPNTIRYELPSLVTNKVVTENSETEMYNAFTKVKSNKWEVYFKTQAKNVRKIYYKEWKKEVKSQNISKFKTKYKTSYVKYQVIIDKNGNIFSHQKKSSCVPYNDTLFFKIADSTITQLKKMSPLPADYKYDNIIITIKLHSKMPQHLNKKFNTDSINVADIEVSPKKYDYIIKRDH